MALALAAAMALPASASSWFDWSVCQQVEGISLTGEDAAGEAYAMVDALASGADGLISAGNGTVRVIPAVGTNEEMAFSAWCWITGRVRQEGLTR